MAEGAEFQLSDYNRIIYRQFRFIFIMAAAAGVAGLLVGTRQPKIYKASALVEADFKVFFEGAEVNPVLTGDLRENMGEMVTDLSGVTVLLDAAKDLGLVESTLIETHVRHDTEALAVLNSIRGKLNIKPLPAQNRIEIGVVSRIPAETAEIANALSRAYKKYSFEKKVSFFREKERKFRESLELCKAALGEIVRRTVEVRSQLKGMVDEDFHKKQRKKIINLERENKMTGYVLSILQAQMEELDNVRTMVMSGRGHPSNRTAESMQELSWLEELARDDPGLNVLHKQLVEMLIDRKEKIRYNTPDHPQMRLLNRKIISVLDDIDHALNTRKNNLVMQRKRIELRKSSITELLKRQVVDDFVLNWLDIKYKSQEEICGTIETSLSEVEVSRSGLVPYITVISSAEVPKEPQGLGTVRIALIGMAAGIFLGMTLSIFREIADTSFHTVEDVKRVLGKYPVTAVVPEVKYKNRVEKGRRKTGEVFRTHYREMLPVLFNKLSPAAEPFKIMAAQVASSPTDQTGNVWLITSSDVQEGKTFVSVNLSFALAQQGKQVCLLEANLRNPVLGMFFGLEGRPGITNILTEEKKYEECRLTISDVLLGTFSFEVVTFSHGLNNLDILTCGTCPPNPTELLSSRQMEHTLNELRSDYDYVIMDSPSLAGSSDTMLLSRSVDNVIVVYRSGKVARRVLQSQLENIEFTGAHIGGIVLNRWTDEYLFA